MKTYVKDLKSLVTLLLTLGILAATFLNLLEAKDALVPLALMVYTFYFTKKDNTQS